MRKDDMDIQTKVMEELGWDPSVRNEEIAVAVKDGVVTLAGFVDSYAQKRAAERATERVSGVHAVAEGLQVRLPGAHVRSDTELAHQVATALQWDVQVPDDRVKARVENGWITLEGQVEWQYQRNAADRAVRDMTGVRGVTNLVTIEPRVSTYDVTKRIKDALRRRAELDAGGIEVEAREGTVTLKGTVRSWLERRDAENAAWGALGVNRVDDRLTVKT